MKPLIAMILLSACATDTELGHVEQHQSNGGTVENCVDITDAGGNKLGKECTYCEKVDIGSGIQIDVCEQIICDNAGNCSPGSLGDPGTPARPVTVSEFDVIFESFDQVRVWSAAGTFAQVPSEAMIDGARTRGAADYDGNGARELFFEANDGTITSRYNIEGSKLLGVRQWRSTDWRFLSKGRFDADGVDDQLWRSSKGELAIIFGGDQRRAVPIGTISPEWAFAAAGDLGGDGFDDLMWTIQGKVQIWTQVGGKVTATRTAWTGSASFGALGDFDGDRRDDILWRDGAKATIWWAGTGGKANKVFAIDPSLVIEGAHDVDGNGRAELLLETAKGGDPVRGLKLDVLDAAVTYGIAWTPRF